MKNFIQLFKAATKKADVGCLDAWLHQRQPVTLPAISITKTFSTDELAKTVRQFNTLHQWQQSRLHPCFPLFLGITQHIDALTHPSSPFSLMGLVHVDNEIIQHHSFSQGAITSHCYFETIRLHERGIVVDITIDFSQGDTLCQTARSTYLYRHTSDRALHACEQRSGDVKQQDQTTSAINKTIVFEGNAGRRYAKISGDYNPIHLFNWSARLFGFKSVMAHGTHVLARALSVVDSQQALPAYDFVIRNQFHYPVPLPSELVLTFGCNNEMVNSFSFSLQNLNASKRKQVVMSGSMALID